MIENLKVANAFMIVDKNTGQPDDYAEPRGAAKDAKSMFTRRRVAGRGFSQQSQYVVAQLINPVVLIKLLEYKLGTHQTGDEVLHELINMIEFGA